MALEVYLEWSVCLERGIFLEYLFNLCVEKCDIVAWSLLVGG